MNEKGLFFRAGALCCAGSGLFLMAYWFLYVVFLPYDQIQDGLSILALDADWFWINVLGVLGALFGVLALPALYIKDGGAHGALGTIAFFVALAGSALMLGPMLWDTVLWKALATHDAAILSFKGPIFQSGTFVPFFISAGLIWGLGFALLGAALFKSGFFPKPVAILLGTGPLLFGFGSMTGSLQAIVRSVGIAAFGVGFIWAGLLLWRSPPDDRPASPTP
jgi:hypothetical protein